MEEAAERGTVSIICLYLTTGIAVGLPGLIFLLSAQTEVAAIACGAALIAGAIILASSGGMIAVVTAAVVIAASRS